MLLCCSIMTTPLCAGNRLLVLFHDRSLQKIVHENAMRFTVPSALFSNILAAKANEYIGKPAGEDGNILINGLPGGGKTMAVVIPTIMTWRGIQVIVDVKGDLARFWYLFNKHTEKKVKIFSPGMPDGSSRYDPFMLLRHGGNENLAGNARDLALSLMPLMPAIKDPVWIKATQALSTGAIIYYFDLGLSFVDTMVEIQLKPVTELIAEITDDDNIAAKIQVAQLQKVDSKVIVNVGMELSNLATLVTDPAIITAFSPNDKHGAIDWMELNFSSNEPFDIILEIPEAKLEQWKPMTMLMINQLVRALMQRAERSYKVGEEAPPVLVMLDEFARLGKVSAIKEGLATLRSRGVTFALFIQSLAQLDETYGATAARAIAELCIYKAVLNAADPASQKYFSDLVGTTESTQRSVSVDNDPLDGRITGLGRSVSETREPIIYAHEFLTQKDVVLITPYGFCRVDKKLFVKNRDMFLMPQLLKNRDYALQNPISYTYNQDT